MSFGDFICPPEAALTQPEAFDCPFNMWQIVKIWAYRDTGVAPFATQADLENAITVDPLFAAVDDTKFISTPNLIENLEIPSPEPVTEGGGSNATPFGREITTGMNPIVVNTPMIREIKPSQVTALKKLNAEVKLRFFFINEFGKVIADQFDGTQIRGFKISNFVSRDPQRMGKNTNDKMPFSFNLDYGWADNAIVVEPADYDAINDY